MYQRSFTRIIATQFQLGLTKGFSYIIRNALRRWPHLIEDYLARRAILQASTFPKKRHYAALLVAALLVVLLIFEAGSFGISAYYVFNEPISNVVAVTTYTGTNAYLNVTATGLNPNSSKIIWVDPSVTSSQSGGVLVQSNSGFMIGNATSNENGTLSATFPISSSVMTQIQSDGNKVHTVWVVETNSSELSSGYFSTTADSEQNYSASTLGHGITLFVTLLALPVPFNFNIGQLFLALTTFYIILFAMALNGPLRNLFGAVKKASTTGVSGLLDNSMLATLMVFPIVLGVEILIILLEQVGGVPTGSLPPEDPLLQFVSLLIAPLREELGFRVIPIGIVAFLILLFRGRTRDGLMALWHPARYLKKNDSPAEYGRHLYLTYVMIALSALIFGYAHVYFGGGWGLGKIAAAAEAGVGLGFMYYYYGFPAAVLVHWSVDVFLTVYSFTPYLVTLGNFVYLYTLFLAVVSSVVLVALGIRKLRNYRAGVYPSSGAAGFG